MVASAPAADQKCVSSRLPGLGMQHSSNLNFSLCSRLLSCASFHLPHLLLFQLPAPALVLLHLLAHKGAPFRRAWPSSGRAPTQNYGVNRSISGETRGRQCVNRQHGLTEAEGTKEEMRGGEEEGRGHLIEMEMEQAN